MRQIQLENTSVTVEFVDCIEVTHYDNNETLLLYSKNQCMRMIVDLFMSQNCCN